jgi:hypothetical protein
MGRPYSAALKTLFEKALSLGEGRPIFQGGKSPEKKKKRSPPGLLFPVRFLNQKTTLSSLSCISCSAATS